MTSIPRRDLIATTLAGAAALSAAPLFAQEKAATPREHYELRRYRFRRGPMQKRADEYFKDALIPACTRAGCGPVGVFNVSMGAETPTAYVLITHPSAESAAGLGTKLAADADYRKAGAAFLDAPATDPSYLRIESSLFVAFTGLPKIEVPEKKGRIFELRIYASHSEAANAKKVEMFNGPPELPSEIAIFKRCGMGPVFFGQALVGENLPNLTYMLCYADQTARAAAWAAFGADKDWQKLRATPGYTDPEIVSSITSMLLGPAGYSQV